MWNTKWFWLETRQTVLFSRKHDWNTGFSVTYYPTNLKPSYKPTVWIEDSAKKWTRYSVATMRTYSIHLKPLSVLNHPWLWCYTYLLFNWNQALAQRRGLGLNGDDMYSTGVSRGHTGSPFLNHKKGQVVRHWVFGQFLIKFLCVTMKLILKAYQK